MDNKKMSKLFIENAFIFRKNFRGEKRDFNPNGRRTFYVKLDPDLADVLHDDGWNIKQIPAREEDEPPLNYLAVEVKYNKEYPNLDPKIYIVTPKKKTLLTEDNVHILDTARFTHVELRINPYVWEVNGKSGIKAFVDKMYVEIENDPMDEKYEGIPNGEFTEFYN